MNTVSFSHDNAFSKACYDHFDYQDAMDAEE
jgi:hypothetical protein